MPGEDVLAALRSKGVPVGSISIGNRATFKPIQYKSIFPVIILIAEYAVAIKQKIIISSVYRSDTATRETSHDSYAEVDIWQSPVYSNTSSQILFQLYALPDLYRLYNSLQGATGYRVGHYLRYKDKKISGNDIIKTFPDVNREQMAKALNMHTDGGIHVGFSAKGFPILAKVTTHSFWDCSYSQNNNGDFVKSLSKLDGHLKRAGSGEAAVAAAVQRDLKQFGVEFGICHDNYATGPGGSGNNGVPGPDGQMVDPATGQPIASGDPAEKMTDLPYWAIVTNTVIEEWKLDG